MNYNIFELCREGDLIGVKRLIEEERILHGRSEIRDNFGDTPLHKASWEGHLEIAKYLVEEAKMIPESQDEYGDTPLHCASRRGYLEIVKYFMKHGVDASIKK